MRDRLWNELTQVKHNQFYCVFLLAYRKNVRTIFNIIILTFSSAGIMGWPFWKDFPLLSCVLIAAISLIKLLSPHIIPTETEISKLDKIADFYVDYFNKLESLWFDLEQERIDEYKLKNKFFQLKKQEREINIIVNDIIKSHKKRLIEKARLESIDYLTRNLT